MCHTKITTELCGVLLGKFYPSSSTLLKGHALSEEDRSGRSGAKGSLGWGNGDCFTGIESVVRQGQERTQLQKWVCVWGGGRHKRERKRQSMIHANNIGSRKPKQRLSFSEVGWYVIKDLAPEISFSLNIECEKKANQEKKKIYPSSFIFRR